MLNEATITLSPTLTTPVQAYEIKVISTMNDVPQLSTTTTILVTVTCFVESVNLKGHKIADQSFEINPTALESMTI